MARKSLFDKLWGQDAIANFAVFGGIVSESIGGDGELNEETLLVGSYILLRDVGVLVGVKDGQGLRQSVIDHAKLNGEFAGINYNPAELLDEDDENFESSDEGLAWVAYEDLWHLLEKVAVGQGL